MSKASGNLWSTLTKTEDFSSEDFNSKDLQRVGYVGQHSEVSWLYRLRWVMEQREAGRSISTNPTPISLPSVSFHQNTLDIEIVDEIDWLGRPIQSTAFELLETYFGKFHGSFPIIGKAPFLAQCRAFYFRADAHPGKQWIAILNLVFAIATRHLSYVGHCLASHETHVEFFSRAWKLCMDKDALRNHPNLQQVQVEGLSAFYLLTCGQVNRCALLFLACSAVMSIRRTKLCPQVVENLRCCH